jgi:flagellar basal-body rod modification protein FlgD
MAMDISSVTSDTQGLTGVNRMSDLSSEQFIQILITELQNQDPFNPNDTSALLEQISSIRNIESQMDLQTSMEALVSQNQVASAGGMIGKYVEGHNASNNVVGGVVTSVRVSGDEIILELDSGYSMNMDRVLTISDAAPLSEGGA